MKFRKPSEKMLCLHPFEHHQKDSVSFEIKATGPCWAIQERPLEGLGGGWFNRCPERECINKEEVRASIVTEGKRGGGGDMRSVLTTHCIGTAHWLILASQHTLI